MGSALHRIDALEEGVDDRAAGPAQKHFLECGFARSQGVEVAALEWVETPKGVRLAVTKVEKGQKAEKVLPALLERLVSGLRFRKAMRSRYDEVT